MKVAYIAFESSSTWVYRREKRITRWFIHVSGFLIYI